MSSTTPIAHFFSEQTGKILVICTNGQSRGRTNASSDPARIPLPMGGSMTSRNEFQPGFFKAGGVWRLRYLKSLSNCLFSIWGVLTCPCRWGWAGVPGAGSFGLVGQAGLAVGEGGSQALPGRRWRRPAPGGIDAAVVGGRRG